MFNHKKYVKYAIRENKINAINAMRKKRRSNANIFQLPA